VLRALRALRIELAALGSESKLYRSRAGSGPRSGPTKGAKSATILHWWSSSVSPHHEPVNPVRPGREQRQRGMWVTGSGGRGPPSPDPGGGGRAPSSDQPVMTRKLLDYPRGSRCRWGSCFCRFPCWAWPDR